MNFLKIKTTSITLTLLLFPIALMVMGTGCESTETRESSESVHPSYLGVIFTEYYRGVRVVQVLPGSPADRAGFEKGEIIVAIDDKPVIGRYSLQADIKARPPGTEAVIEVLDKDGVRIKRQVTLEEEPEGPILRPNQSGY